MRNAPSATADAWTHKSVFAVLLALALASLVFWVLQVMAMPRWVADLRFAPQVDSPQAAAATGLARALGAAPKSAAATPAPATAALKLVAVMGAGHHGSALLAPEGQKAQRFEVGAEVSPGLFLLSLGLRQADLGPSPQGPVTLTLTLSVPELPGLIK